LECDILVRLKASVPEEASDVHQSINCDPSDDDGLHAVRELVLVRLTLDPATQRVIRITSTAPRHLISSLRD